MPTEPQPPTLAQVVHRAVEVCGDSSSAGLDDMIRNFEHADQPVASARGDALDEDPVELLALASRAEFGAHPPEHVARWLELQGIAV